MASGLGSLALGCGVAGLMVACVTTNQVRPEEAAPPPVVSLGPTIELLRVRTGHDTVRVVAHGDESVHVLIASRELRQVFDVVVPRVGEPKRSVIKSDISASRLDGAFDAQRRLHALIDTEHMVLEEGVWHSSDQTPWRASGLKVYSARFVPGAPDLIWAFHVNGKEVDAPRRMELFGFGGFGAGIIWPWFTAGIRTVLVSESPAGYGPWVVIEAQGRQDTTVDDIAADDQGSVYLVYSASSGGLASATEHRYVRLTAELLRRNAGSDSGGPGSPESSSKFLSVQGQPIGEHQVVRRESPNGPAFIALPVGPFAGGSRLSSDTGETLHAVTIGEPRNQWWGKGFPVRYQLFSDNAWSGGIDVGVAEVRAFWGGIWDAFDIASVGNDRVFVVWPTEQAIVGRWVEHLP